MGARNGNGKNSCLIVSLKPVALHVVENAIKRFQRMGFDVQAGRNSDGRVVLAVLGTGANGITFLTMRESNIHCVASFESGMGLSDFAPSQFQEAWIFVAVEEQNDEERQKTERSVA